MTQLIKYVYYRIAHALLNLNQWEKGYYDVHAMIYLSLCIVSNIALLIMLICNWVFNISIHKRPLKIGDFCCNLLKITGLYSYLDRTDLKSQTD